VTGELRAFRRKRLTPEEGKAAALRALKVPIEERSKLTGELFLDDPETLLPLLESLRHECESNPAKILEETTFLYQYLERIQPKYPVDAFLLDEREYFLGETARIAGAVSRVLAFRIEARRWFDLADGWFLQTENASGNLAKVLYQRLALRTEERDFTGVFELLPQLIATFEKLGMSEDAIKSRFLQAAALRETEKLSEAIDLYKGIVQDSKTLRNDVLLGHAYTNLAQLYGFLGQAKESMDLANEATPLLRKLGNHVALAKLQWGVGFLQRAQGEARGAIESFRSAQQEFQSIEMRADVAAVQLVIADVLLDVGQEKQAEWEIRQALPLIEEYKLVPEGFAAMTLLRESLRRQKIDRQALRNLHGYFEELQG
jgi:tetratricopeptide (TPR) repeat protein